MRRCYRQICIFMLFATILVLTACQPQDAVLPTLVSLGETPVGETPANAPETTDQQTDVTLTSEATAAPQITATPEQFLGRFANDPQRRANISAIHAAPGTAQVPILPDLNGAAILGIYSGTYRVQPGETLMQVAPGKA